LHDRALVAGMQAAAQGRQLACAKEIPQLLTCLASEVEAPAFWIVPDYLQKTLGPTSPRRERFMQALRHEGHLAERTHLDLQGIRTNAPEDAIRSIWGKLQTVATPKTFGPENRRN
jgi:tRNA G26 N,N-dimethylase Trm1